MFDVLSSLSAVSEATVLDLFAGSGALGIEALSRGASSVTFVDASRGSIEVIVDNLQRTALFEDGRAEVVRSDALNFLRTRRIDYDLAFLDPPYRYTAWQDLLSMLHARTCVIETDRELALPADYELHRSYRYGTTLLTVAMRLDDGPDREP